MWIHKNKADRCSSRFFQTELRIAPDLQSGEPKKASLIPVSICGFLNRERQTEIEAISPGQIQLFFIKIFLTKRNPSEIQP